LPEVGEEFTVTLTVKSKGNIYSFDNLIHFEIPYGLEMAPNERLEYPEFTYFAPDSNWWFLDIMPNEERILSAKLVRTKDVPINLFSQVVSTYPADLDSEPDNGICCNAVEDDEAILRFKLVRLSNPNVSTRGNDTLIDFSCRAFPNPFKNELNFNIKSERQGDGKIQIYDVLGRLILEKPIQLIVGENLKTIETTNLPPGILTAKISNSENEFQRIQILKQ